MTALRRGLALAVLAWLPTAAFSDSGIDWRAPFAISLPEPARTVLLREGIDAQRFVSRHAVVGARHMRGGAGAIVEVRLSDAAWATAQGQWCVDAEVAACETVACQGIQLAGTVDPATGQQPDAARARLVQNPPETLPAPAEGEAGTCHGPPLLPPLDATGAPAASDMVVDLRSPQQLSSDEGTPQRRSFAFGLDPRIGPAGILELGTDQLPDDASNWTLVAGARCDEVAVPLDSLVPAQERGQIVALVATGSAAAVAAANGLSVIREVQLAATGDVLVVFATSGDVGSAVAALAKDPRVTGAQPQFIYRTAAEPGGTHSDPYAQFTYGPAQTGALKLHSAGLGTGQLIAVIDTGLDLAHPELKGRIRGHQDTTGSGWSADGHGTAIAAVIAANADNDEGSYGVAPNAELLALKACAPREPGSLGAKCWTSSLVTALDVAISQGATVINMSLTGPPDALVARHVEIALQQGRIVVAAAGNGGPQARPAHPAALEGVIAVTAIDAADRPYRDANRGDYIDVSAPGVDIMVPTPGGEYAPLSGTSMAAAHVSGVAALLRALVPNTDAAMLRRTLTTAVRDLGDVGRDAIFGNGLLDACGAWHAADSSAAASACAPRRDGHATPDL